MSKINLKIKIPKDIMLLLGLAVFLNLIRILLFQNTTFIYLFWNLFLALVPFLLSSILFLNTKSHQLGRPMFLIGFLFWFIFLPNAPYILTDFIHLGRISGVPVMFDIFVIFSTAYVSLLLGLHSLFQIEKILKLKFSKETSNAIITVVILFASFGIYLGRYLRFNSWDIFVSHNSLMSNIWKIFSQANNYVNVYLYTLLFFIFLSISFLAFKYNQNDKLK